MVGNRVSIVPSPIESTHSQIKAKVLTISPIERLP
jgi:hypothetical protein